MASASSPRLQLAVPSEPLPGGALVPAGVLRVRADGLIEVDGPDGRQRTCAWLENGVNQAVRLAAGDRVLVLIGNGEAEHVVMGRVGRHPGDTPPADVKVESTQRLTLQCGASSIDLRADGKVVIRGDDVLVRARGAKRIRAGTVSIN